MHILKLSEDLRDSGLWQQLRNTVVDITHSYLIVLIVISGSGTTSTRRIQIN